MHDPNNKKQLTFYANITEVPLTEELKIQGPTHMTL